MHSYVASGFYKCTLLESLLILTRVDMATKIMLPVIVLMVWLVERGLTVHHEPLYMTVRTSQFDTVSTPSFINLPTSIHHPAIKDYEKVSLEKGFRYPMHLYCLCNDPRLCLFFDFKGLLSGIQMSYKEVSYVDPKVYNFNNSNFIDTYFHGCHLKSVRIYFTNPEKLSVYGRNCAPHDIFEGLWTWLDGMLVRYDSKCQPNSPAIGDFDMVGCAPKIGQMYVRKFNEKSTCHDGFFLYMAYEKGKLVGFGHGIPGIASPGPKINVYNYPNGTTLQLLKKNQPPCYCEMAQYGLTMFGIWIIQDPWNIRCPQCLCDS